MKSSQQAEQKRTQTHTSYGSHLLQPFTKTQSLTAITIHRHYTTEVNQDMPTA